MRAFLSMMWFRNGGGNFDSARDAVSGAGAVFDFLDDLRDFEEVMAARRSEGKKRTFRRDSGGGHRIDDGVVHHYTAHSCKDVAADQSAFLVVAVAPVRPLLHTGAIAEGLSFCWLI